MRGNLTCIRSSNIAIYLFILFPPQRNIVTCINKYLTWAGLNTQKMVRAGEPGVDMERGA